MRVAGSREREEKRSGCEWGCLGARWLLPSCVGHAVETTPPGGSECQPPRALGWTHGRCRV